MKQITRILKLAGFAILGSIIASISMAKVADFNALINENISAQKELHGEIKKQMNTSEQAFRESLEKREASSMVVEGDLSNVNPKTSKKMLQYKREKSMKSVSQKKQMDRISQEFNDADAEF